MRIQSMTATFGKLSGDTLTLKPGLNILEKPNEWGKSTWCAFLAAMLYGIDTSSRSKKDFLADKEHYAPWSGEPMSGRMEIQWKGRSITLERTTRGRAAMGCFRAYETDTGLDIPELTGENCGKMLLGVEKSVFLRAGFLRLRDLPLTPDDTLRRRLNSLVTTGDDSGAAEQLGQKLRELGNRVHRNSSGLLPRAQEELTRLEELSRKQGNLQSEEQEIVGRLQELSREQESLENHMVTLQARQDAELEQRISRQKAACAALETEISRQKQILSGAPSRETLALQKQQIIQLREQAAEMEQIPESSIFQGCDPEQAVARARQDAEEYDALTHPTGSKALLWLIPGTLLAVAGGVLLALAEMVWGPVALVAGMGLMLVSLIQRSAEKNLRQNRLLQARMLGSRYGTLAPEQWVQAAQEYGRSAACARGRQALLQRRDALTGGISLGEFERKTEDILERYRALEENQRELNRLRETVEALQSSRREQTEVCVPDGLTLTREETEAALEKNRTAHTRLQQNLGRCRGQLSAIPDGEQLLQELEQTRQRAARLGKIERAIALAQEVQTQAARELQRRFAPRIAKRAGELMEHMTQGRYDRLTLGEDLSVLSGTGEETTLRGCLWRSDGTADQLYLALRLAVAEALTPEAPLILDDALVRFDDVRLQAVLELLQQAGKQVILFTCQSRERKLVKES